MPNNLPPVTPDLLEWYDRQARKLPWRIGPAERAAGARPDPYHVWLSEIMLQQTTVAAVRPYFERFLERWPSVRDLAAADPEEVMAAWAGLGYYARARNLIRCAQTVTHSFGGAFPASAAELRHLPGIGDYTSAAIAAIAFDEPAAVVDGNVERVTARLFAIEAPLPSAKPTIVRLVGALTPEARPGDFAQAMMDLGATVCLPKRPACFLCPVAAPCRARQDGNPERYPLKLPKRLRPVRRGAAFVAVRQADGAVWLHRRAEDGMLGGMASPPMSAWSVRADGALGQTAAPFPADWRLGGRVSHVFTHFELDLEVWSAEICGDPDLPGWWSSPAALPSEALPTLMRKVLRAAEGKAPAGRISKRKTAS